MLASDGCGAVLAKIWIHFKIVHVAFAEAIGFRVTAITLQVIVSDYILDTNFFILNVVNLRVGTLTKLFPIVFAAPVELRKSILKLSISPFTLLFRPLIIFRFGLLGDLICKFGNAELHLGPTWFVFRQQRFWVETLYKTVIDIVSPWWLFLANTGVFFKWFLAHFSAHF